MEKAEATAEIERERGAKRVRQFPSASDADFQDALEGLIGVTRGVSRVIKKARGMTLEPRLCDFCGELSSNHYCKASFAGASAIIDGEPHTKICGKSVCIRCREKWGMNEADQAYRCLEHRNTISL